MRALRYAFDEARRQPLARPAVRAAVDGDDRAWRCSSSAAFLLVTSNLERLGDEWSRAAEMSVYLARRCVGGGPARPSSALLAPGALVAGFEFVSKDEALRALQADVRRPGGDRRHASTSNPLPASYEVRLQAGAGHDGSGRRAGRDAARDARASPTSATTGSGSIGCCRPSTLIRSGRACCSARF